MTSELALNRHRILSKIDSYNTRFNSLNLWLDLLAGKSKADVIYALKTLFCALREGALVIQLTGTS